MFLQFEYLSVFTAGELIWSIRTVGVIVTLLFLCDTLIVTTAELVGRADSWSRRGNVARCFNGIFLFKKTIKPKAVAFMYILYATGRRTMENYMPVIGNFLCLDRAWGELLLNATQIWGGQDSRTHTWNLCKYFCCKQTNPAIAVENQQKKGDVSKSRWVGFVTKETQGRCSLYILWMIRSIKINTLRAPRQTRTVSLTYCFYLCNWNFSSLKNCRHL